MYYDVMQGDTALHYAYRSVSTDVIDLLEQHTHEIKNIKNDVRDSQKLLWVLHILHSTKWILVKKNLAQVANIAMLHCHLYNGH